ncbi:MAG: 50S ribosomal protein L29 [Alphaproteobacteria bacterium MarineAlpha5_Bin9]|nr:MAG: 50S ribosomal protein L29 [Alphaproteobacteria bacterium MarineAlpha5_Bin9]|tara:strand:+ start:2907 stop:3104 length:198 start_codon:yes stop_codon:yes gene_type:complete
MSPKNKKSSLQANYSEINSLRKKLLNFRFQKSSGQLEKTDGIKKTRKKIAQLLTQINKKQESKNA